MNGFLWLEIKRICEIHGIKRTWEMMKVIAGYDKEIRHGQKIDCPVEETGTVKSQSQKKFLDDIIISFSGMNVKEEF